MGIGNIFILLYISYFTIYFFTLIFSNTRRQIRASNKRLDKLRKVPVKTMEEQKEFLNLRYPKTTSKFTLMTVIIFIFRIGVFIGIYRIHGYWFSLLNIEIPIGLAILLIITLPILINFILKKFNLQTQDITVFFR